MNLAMTDGYGNTLPNRFRRRVLLKDWVESFLNASNRSISGPRLRGNEGLNAEGDS